MTEPLSLTEHRYTWHAPFRFHARYSAMALRFIQYPAMCAHKGHGNVYGFFGHPPPDG